MGVKLLTLLAALIEAGVVVYVLFQKAAVHID